MKQIQTELPNFEIRIDGELQRPSVLERTSSVVGNVLVSTLQATYEASKRVLGECATSLALDITDAREGTQLRSEWIAKRREERTTRLRHEYRLD